MVARWFPGGCVLVQRAHIRYKWVILGPTFIIIRGCAGGAFMSLALQLSYCGPLPLLAEHDRK